jgi:hypothetical protein
MVYFFRQKGVVVSFPPKRFVSTKEAFRAEFRELLFDSKCDYLKEYHERKGNFDVDHREKFSDGVKMRAWIFFATKFSFPRIVEREACSEAR